MVTRSTVLVSPAGSEDLTHVLDLWSAAREEAGSPRIDSAGKDGRRLLTHVLSRDGVQMFVARHDGFPVGYLLLTSGPLLPLVDSPSVCIEHLYVRPEVRHRGVATSLIAASTTYAERIGAEQMTSNVPSSEREPNRFFARLGFSPFVVRRVVAVGTLRRRLAGDTFRGSVETTLLRRRSLRARDRARALVPSVPAPR
jgi:GNAT superfamily N-acetyltransferase